MTKTQLEMAAHDKITWQLFGDAQHAGDRLVAARSTLARAEKQLNSNVLWERSNAERNIAHYKEMVAEASREEAAAALALSEHEKAYEGWARFWCVPNGHIHSSRNCSTCNKMGKSTAFFLAHEVSGMDEAAAVQAQGPVLCTVCFPSAPLDWTNGLDAVAQAKKDAQCPGSGKAPAEGRPGASYKPCSVCENYYPVTMAGVTRAHKRAKKDEK